MDINWDVLHERALEAARTAYAPYSNFRVGAAALVDDGRIISGCNVENASYGLTLCAECGLVSELIATGGGRLIAVVTMHLAIQDDDTERVVPCMPCGRCRQLLWEHGGASCLLNGDGRVQPMTAVLPGAFDATELDGSGASS